MKAKAKIMVSILAGMGLLYGCRSTFPVTTANYTIRKETVDLANGKNLAFNVCGPCHYDYHINSFIGKEMRDLPGFMGRVYSANLTHGHILSQYNDAELFYLIKTGIAHDGRYIPYMIRPTIADQDLNDIIAYFRSDDDPVGRNDSMAGITRLSFLGKLAGKIMSKPQDYRTGTPQPPADPVSQGR